mgnify:FL=1
MSEIAMNAAHMIDMLPDPDKNLAYELIKKLVLAWDPDFTKLTTEEAKQIDTVADMVFSLLVKYKKLAEYLNAVECDILHSTSEVKRVVDFVIDQEIVILEEMVLQSERRGGG